MKRQRHTRRTQTQALTQKSKWLHRENIRFVRGRCEQRTDIALENVAAL